MEFVEYDDVECDDDGGREEERVEGRREGGRRAIYTRGERP